MKRAPYPAAAEALADRLLRSIRPQVVQIIAEAFTREMRAVEPKEAAQLTEEDYAEAAETVARWGRQAKKRPPSSGKR